MSYFYASTRIGNPSQSSVPATIPQSGCGGASIFDAAASYIGLVPKGNLGNQPEDGCAVDTQSSLLWGDANTNRERGPKQVFPRPYATTPFLAGGTISGIDDQSKVLFGLSTANRKSVQGVADTQFPVFEPLLPSRVSDIPENNYFVEPFLRGGLASRMIPHTRVDLK